MTDRTAAPHGDRPEAGGATAPPICRRLFCIEQAADVAEKPVLEICRWIRIGKCISSLNSERP